MSTVFRGSGAAAETFPGADIATHASKTSRWVSPFGTRESKRFSGTTEVCAREKD
jgi:hypothetical protein